MKRVLDNLQASGDLGCMNIRLVTSTQSRILTHGIVFALTNSGCFSALGVAPGFTGGFKSSITQLGVPRSWQLVSVAEDCFDGLEETAIIHLLLHVLGRGHEHNRPDRDNFINVLPDNAITPAEYIKYPIRAWSPNSQTLEINSIMMTSSFTNAKSPQDPVIRLKTSSAFFGGIRLSTQDALHIQEKYCPYTNPTVLCPSKGRVGMSRKIFSNRICDGIKDCPEGEDEDGTLGKCIPYGVLSQNQCCQTLIANGEIFSRDGEFNSKDFYRSADNSDHIIFYDNDIWYYGIG